MPLGENKKVFVLDSQPFKTSELIAVIPEFELKDLRELYRAINVYGSNQKSEEYGLPLHSEAVFLAFCNNQWHRAILAENVGDGYPSCLLIDLGCNQKINVKKMIPMPRVFAELPPFVRICRIAGFDKNSEDIKTAIGDIVIENEILTVDEIFEDEEGIVLRFNAIMQHSSTASIRSC